MPQRFRMGIVLISPGAVKVLQAIAGNDFWHLAATLIARHEDGDWGDIEPVDAALNEHNLLYGGSLRSAYELPPYGRLLIHTAADRALTNVLLPAEL